MKHSLIGICFVCFLGLISSLTAQEATFELVLPTIDSVNGRVVLPLLALNSNGEPEVLRFKDLAVAEFVGQADGVTLSLDPTRLRDSLLIVKDTVRRDTITISLLVDVSQAVSASAWGETNLLLQQLARKIPSNGAFRIFLRSFSDSPQQRQLLDAAEIQPTLRSTQLHTDKAPDLYRALVEELRFLNGYEGKRMLFVFSPGMHDIEDNPRYGYDSPFLPYDQEDISSHLVNNLSANYSLFMVGVGDTIDQVFFTGVSEQIANTSSNVSSNSLPDNLDELVSNNQQFKHTHLLLLSPSQKKFTTEEARVYGVEWAEGGQNVKSPPLIWGGSALNPVNIEDIAGDAYVRWLLLGVLGAIVLVVLLVVFAQLVPVIQSWNFNRNHVRIYQSVGSKTEYDPVTKIPLRDGDQVVYKCQYPIPLRTWQDIGNRCPRYPGCTNYENPNPCNGAGAPQESGRFFSMKGIYRRLNWLWFGVAGGYLAWLLFAIISNANVDFYRQLWSGLYNEQALVAQREGSAALALLEAQVNNVTDDTLLGIVFSLGIIFMLAWMEERNQPRKISWGRILLRVVAAIPLGILVFGGTFLWYSVSSSFTFLIGLVGWAFFGVGMGLVLSIRSSIIPMRGILGGLLAGVAAYLMYFLLVTILPANYLLFARLLALMVMGGVLGLVLVTVLSRLEDFELEYISASAGQHIAPISKWLKNGTSILIGRDPTCYVYIKQDDSAVQAQHARLSFENGQVFITPLAETLVRGRELPADQKSALQNGDIIQLGRDSTTQMRYREKRKDVNRRPPRNGGNTKGGPPRIKILK